MTTVRFTMSLLMAAAAAAGAWAQAPDLSKLDIVLRSVPDGPVASVRGTTISRGEFIDLYRQELAAFAAESGGDVPDDMRVQLGLRCLGILVEREILYQEAHRRKLEPPKGEVEKAWSVELRQLQRAFARGGNVPTEEDLLAQAGVTRDAALAEVRKSLLIDMARDAIIKDAGITVTDAEVRAYIQENESRFRRPAQVHIKQIYLRATPPGNGAPKAGETREAARKRAETALERIQAGQSFEGVARDMSDGVQRENGGDFGKMPANALPPFLVEAAQGLKPGGISGIIESEFGFHIVKLVELEAGGEPNWKEIEPLIRELLASQKGTPAVKEFARNVTDDESALTVYLDLMRQVALRPELQQRLAETLGE